MNPGGAQGPDELARELAAFLRVGDAGEDVAHGIATTASVIATVSAVASSTAGGLAVSAIVTTLGVSAAAVATVPIVGWIAGAALAVAAAFAAIGNWLAHNWTPAEAAAGLKLMAGNPALFGMIAPPAAWTNTGRRADIWVSLIRSWEERAGHTIPPIFTDRAWVQHAIQQGERMAALPGPVGARFLLATTPDAAMPSVTGYDAWISNLHAVAAMTPAEYAASNHAQAQYALQRMLTLSVARERGFTPQVNVYESSMIADQRGALWALSHPTDGRAVPAAIAAADAFRAYVARWHDTYESRDTPDAPLGGGCEDRGKDYPAKAKKALDILRKQPSAFGWLDLAWVNSLGYSRADNFMSTTGLNRCAQDQQLKDLVDGFAKCIGGDVMNDGDAIRSYLAAAQSLGAPAPSCTPSGIPYLVVTPASPTAPSVAGAAPLSAEADLVLGGLRSLLEGSS